VVGLYYVADGAALSAAIAELLERGIQTKGEYYLADAFNVMIQHGARVITRPVSVWEDCGVPDTVLHTNQYLLAHGHDREAPTINSVLVPPVHIAEGAHIENAVVGPYVTVGEGVRIVNAVVRDAIIEAGSSVENVVLEHTLIGRNARVKGAIGRLNIGDDDALDLG
jgi:glucose-1-phosphate thymidylyltransferase